MKKKGSSSWPQSRIQTGLGKVSFATSARFLTKPSGLLHVQGAGNIHQLVTHRSFHITGKQPLDYFSAVINSYQCDCQGMGNSHVHGTTCSGRLTATFSGLQQPELQLFHSVAQRVKRKNLNIKLVFTMQYR